MNKYSSSKLFYKIALMCLSLGISNLTAELTGVVGYIRTTLPGGAGSLFAPSFIHNNSFEGSITSVTSGTNSILSLAELTANEFNEEPNFPAYYLEVLDDTNNSDGIDTEGLILDIISNTENSVTIAANASLAGIQGNESVAIRKHLTLTDVFKGSTLSAFADIVTFYNSTSRNSIESYLPDGTGGWLLTDFVTPAGDPVIYPGTGFVINNRNDIVVLVTGTVKTTDTQVQAYGGSSVNFLSSFKPINNFDMSSDGRIEDAFPAFNPFTTYNNGPLTVNESVLSGLNGGFVDFLDFVTPATLLLDQSEVVVVTTPSDTVYKVTGATVPE